MEGICLFGSGHSLPYRISWEAAAAVREAPFGVGGGQASTWPGARFCFACVPLVFRLYSAYTPSVYALRSGGDFRRPAVSLSSLHLLLAALAWPSFKRSRIFLSKFDRGLLTWFDAVTY
jgi:hypothetical protein